MAKTLKDFLNERQLGPMVVKNPDEQKFIDKHVVAKTDDRNGNDDELFKGSKVKMADRPKHRKGYNPGEDEEVYEEAELAESKYEFDVSGEHGNAAVDKLVKHANSNGIKAKVHTYNGPGGGNPVIHLSHKDPKVVHAYAKKHIDPDVDLSDHKINEALKGAQHKIDANKNGKVDAHDFKLLRGKKKVAEEAEELEELDTATLKSYRTKARAQGNAIVDKMKMGGGDWSKDQKDTKTLRKRAAGAQASGKQLVKRGESLKTEEAEQIVETAKIVAHLQKRYGDNIRKSHVSSAAKDFGVDASKLAKAVRTKLGKNMLDEEQIDEISATTKDSYAKKAVKQLPGLFKKSGETADGARKYYNRKNTIRKIANEEAEQIDELEKKTLGSYIKKASGAEQPKNVMSPKNVPLTKIAAYQGDSETGYFGKRFNQHTYDKAERLRKNRETGIKRATDKLTKEEVEAIEEKLNMDTASMGTVVKDFQKSDAPQFKGKSQDKRRAMAIAAKLTAERGGKPLRKEEKLADLLGDLTETHRRTMLSVFDKLNEGNQKKFLEACETPEGVESMLDFSISHRGE